MGVGVGVIISVCAMACGLPGALRINPPHIFCRCFDSYTHGHRRGKQGETPHYSGAAVRWKCALSLSRTPLVTKIAKKRRIVIG